MKLNFGSMLFGLYAAMHLVTQKALKCTHIYTSVISIDKKCEAESRNNNNSLTLPIEIDECPTRLTHSRRTEKILKVKYLNYHRKMGNIIPMDRVKLICFVFFSHTCMHLFLIASMRI